MDPFPDHVERREREIVRAAEDQPIDRRFRYFRLTLGLILVRLRFPLLVLAIVAVIAYWPWWRHQWDRLTRPQRGPEGTVSLDTEYWCPMCPGVLSDWPAKCPVCHMTLVRRTKGEATPLPDGVVARMQFTPYRVQLAGIRTTPVEFRPVAWEAQCGGNLEGTDSGGFVLAVDVPEVGLAAIRQGVEAAIDALPNQTFTATVRDAGAVIDGERRTFRVRLAIADARRELRGGLFAVANFRVPIALLDASMRQWRDNWRDRSALELAARSSGVESLLDSGCRLAFAKSGMSPAIPTSSVIDTGELKVVFVERMPGMFDGIEVKLGRRCGDYYPVVAGVNPGERVVTVGAFLLDAETRLNPSLAASYFGAGNRQRQATPSAATAPSSEDEKLIAKQKICPVTDEPLGSMGGPVKLVVEGRIVFICCKGCESELRGHAKQYLAKIPK